MEIQQHDGVVVEVAGSRQGFAKLSERERCHGREREAPGAVVRLPSLPSTIYRGPWGGAGPRRSDLQGGAAAKGVPCPPSQVEAPPPLGFPTLGTGGPRGGTPAHQVLVPLPLHPMGPSRMGGPTRWTPGTLPVVPVQYR